MATVRYTVIDGEVIAEKRGGVRSLYVPDPLGSTVALLNSSQTKTDTFTYWPYGEVKTRTGTTATPFQYVGTRGCYQDTSTQIQMRARVQKPNYGRFLTQDPIGFRGRDWNPYRYVKNRPVTLVDPWGLSEMIASNSNFNMLLSDYNTLLNMRIVVPPRQSRPKPIPKKIICDKPINLTPEERRSQYICLCYSVEADMLRIAAAAYNSCIKTMNIDLCERNYAALVHEAKRFLLSCISDCPIPPLT